MLQITGNYVVKALCVHEKDNFDHIIWVIKLLNRI